MKKGFTLAEVLITLGIIGVVSALTVPALMSNVQKNSIGASVAKAYNTLSNASEMILAQEGASTISSVADGLTEGDKRRGAYSTLYSRYTKGARVSSTEDLPDYTEYDGTTAYNLEIGRNLFQTNDGMIFYLSDGFEEIGNSSEFYKQFSGDALEVHVDINGAKGPNALGKDLFFFYIDDYGIVIPYGGLQWEAYVTSGSSWSSPGGGNQCRVDEDGKSHVDDGRACAGSIADNGWKAIY